MFINLDIVYLKLHIFHFQPDQRIFLTLGVSFVTCLDASSHSCSCGIKTWIFINIIISIQNVCIYFNKIHKKICNFYMYICIYKIQSTIFYLYNFNYLRTEERATDYLSPKKLHERWKHTS